MVNKLWASVGPTLARNHGEAFVWERGGKAAPVAIDAGGRDDVGREVGQCKPRILILTHDDNDHIGGATTLIKAAGSALKELWVPAEWGILVKQLASSLNMSAQSDPPFTSIAKLASEIAVRLSDEVQMNSESSPDNPVAKLTTDEVSNAERVLENWKHDPASAFLQPQANKPAAELKYWYGAKSYKEIVDRVNARAKPLLKILKTAIHAGILVRYFSVDVAQLSTQKYWESAGQRGQVTLANAIEVPTGFEVRLNPGIAVSYGLTRLTVQNRRALSTLLWADSRSLDGAALVWSDTDGNWLPHATSLGFDKVLDKLSATSAPHHASGNSAHDQAWAGLAGHLLARKVIVCAGGMWKQTYRPEFIKASRSTRRCSWCRPRDPVQRVVVEIQSGVARLIGKQCTVH